jgi:hypothetical protein
MSLFIALALAAAVPTAEAERLGRALAEGGTLAALLPLIQQKETEEMVGQSDLTDAEKAALRVTANRVFEEGRERLMAATGKAYAERLGVADLRALVTFEQSDAAKRYRRAMPGAIAAAMQAAGPMDFKKDVRAAFCKETGKLCDGK